MFDEINEQIDESLKAAGIENLSEDDIKDIEENPSEAENAEDPGEAAEEKTATEEPKEESAQAEPKKSFLIPPKQEIGEEIPEEERHTGRYVPVYEHAKLRERLRAAEAELEKTRTGKVTETAPESAGEDPFSDLEDDDVLTFGEAKGLVEKILANKQTEQAAQTQEQVQRTEAEQFLVQSEENTRKAFPDYDAVVEKAMSEGLISKVDYEAVMSSRDPAKKLYAISRRELSSIGVDLSTGSSVEPDESKENGQNPNEDDMEVMSDEDVFNSVFGGPSFR